MDPFVTVMFKTSVAGLGKIWKSWEPAWLLFIAIGGSSDSKILSNYT
jgi:hypothetical protein